MAEGPSLRSVPPAPAAESAGAPAAGGGAVGEPEGVSWLTIALAGALAVAIAVLVWSRISMTERIEALQDEIRGLEAAVTTRDVVIGAQRGRIEDVRGRVEDVRSRVEGLQTLLDEPLPDVD